MDKELLLSMLPPYQGKKILIKRDQSVTDIMTETLNAHDAFANDYDKIAHYFIGRSDEGTLEKLFNFLKTNVAYKEEPEEVQQTKSPAAIIETGVCDCKCYAIFIGGVLDALNRLGGRFDWNYAYAAYNEGIAHVFVQARVEGKEFWVDPVLSKFNQRYPRPKHIVKKKKSADMALYRVSGVENPNQIKKFYEKQRANPAVGSIGDFISQNPGITVAAALVIFYLLTRKRR